MRKESHPQTNSPSDCYYDMMDDWGLIVASFAQQYGIRLHDSDYEDMSWVEFCQLLSGLNSDTPLGQIVSIRAEKDPKKIKQFNKEQHRIRHEWLKKTNAQKSDEEKATYWREFQKMAKAAFRVVQR